MFGSSHHDRGLKALMTFACAVIVVAGLKQVGPVVLPVLISAFIALMAEPPLRALQRRNVPDWLAVSVVFLGGLVPFVGFSALLTSSIADFQERLPVYQVGLTGLSEPILAWLSTQEIISVNQLRSSLDSSAILTTFGSWLGAIGKLLSNTLLVVMTVAFIMAEMAGFPNKIRLALGKPDADLGQFSVVVDDVKNYLVIKAKVSLLTGVLAFILVEALGVDFAPLWGVVAFMLNFVPTIGSIVAALPPLALALVDVGWERALVLIAGYVVINMVIGNVLEPRWMGRRLGLSTLVVFLSLVFWGWLWGTIGMLLSVPLTMVVKILFEYSDDLRWVGVLLGPSPRSEQMRALVKASLRPEIIAVSGPLDTGAAPDASLVAPVLPNDESEAR